MDKPTVFVSYSHQDETWKDKLVTHLGVLVNEDFFTIWDDRCIQTGKKWYPSIKQAIESSSVAILLVSADFLTSRFILGEEIPPILQFQEEKDLWIYPIIIRPCAWDMVSWLSPIQVKPKDGKPLSSVNTHIRETHFTLFAKEIAKYLQENENKKIVSVEFEKLDKTKINIDHLPYVGTELFKSGETA